MTSDWMSTAEGLWPSANLVSPIENPDLAADGYPWGLIYDSEFSEVGLGLLFDIDVSRWNFLIGGRYDGSRAKDVDRASSYNPVTGTSANPGAYFGTDESAAAWDDAVSWSLSASYALQPNVRSYVTLARSAIVLDGNNNALSINTIRAGHIGSATLGEVGIKASLLDDRLFASASLYEQARADVDLDDPADVILAYPTATEARGVSAEIKWVPMRNLFLSAYAMHQVTRYTPNYSSAQLVDARTLGFQDVLDSSGNVIYPAEAFLYGGRARLILRRTCRSTRGSKETPSCNSVSAPPTSGTTDSGSLSAGTTSPIRAPGVCARSDSRKSSWPTPAFSSRLANGPRSSTSAICSTKRTFERAPVKFSAIRSRR